MIDTVSDIMGTALIVMGHVFRYLSAVLALLLIVRAVFIRNVGAASSWFGIPLYEITSIFERPVRRMLPDRFTAAPYDYAPVVAAALLLLFGLGAHEFFDVLTHELLPGAATP